MPDADEDVPNIPVVCPDCDTRTKAPFPDVEDAVARHNEQLHDGEAVATVDVNDRSVIVE